MANGGEVSYKLDGGIDDMATGLAQMLKDIWEQKGMPSAINKEVTLGFANKIWSGLKEGYGKDVGNIDYNSPDFNMLTHLQTNVYAFSAAKNWQQMKAITQSMIGEDRKLRTFAQFKDAAGLINTTYEGWLRTEYNTAVASGQMASKWVDIQANKDVLPMLEYDAVMDGRTSDICADFNGIIKEVDDAFWNAFYPPNHFGCRSTVRQLSSGKPTNTSNLAIPEKIPEMFKVNLAKERLAFPPTHPYYIGLPSHVNKEAAKLQNKEILNWAKENLKGKHVITDEIGRVDFNVTGIKEIMNQPHIYKQAKNLAIYAIESIMKNAKFVQSSPDIKGNTMVKAWHYFDIQINGEKSYAVVRELITGEKVLYSIVDSLK